LTSKHSEPAHGSMRSPISREDRPRAGVGWSHFRRRFGACGSRGGFFPGDQRLAWKCVTERSGRRTDLCYAHIEVRAEPNRVVDVEIGSLSNAGGVPAELTLAADGPTLRAGSLGACGLNNSDPWTWLFLPSGYEGPDGGRSFFRSSSRPDRNQLTALRISPCPDPMGWLLSASALKLG
jgi:hypothetical protein